MTLWRVLNGDGEDATGPPGIVAHLVGLDVALLLEDGGERLLLLGGRHAHLVVHRHVGVAHAGEHVGDRISHHRALTTSPARFRDTGDLACMDELAKADAAQPELAIHGLGAAATTAPGVRPHLEFGLALLLLDECLLRHYCCPSLRNGK